MPETTPDAPAPGSGAESLPVRWLGGRRRVAVLFAVAALLGVFTYRFFSFLAPTIPAVVALPALPRVGRELACYAPIGPEPSEPSG